MDIAVDQDGYLVDLADWSEAVASSLASETDITLSDDHWTVINAVREFYQATGISPAMRPLVKLMRTTPTPDLASSLTLMRLFPGNPAKTVARIAGLPKPTNCL